MKRGSAISFNLFCTRAATTSGRRVRAKCSARPDPRPRGLVLFWRVIATSFDTSWFNYQRLVLERSISLAFNRQGFTQTLDTICWWRISFPFNMIFHFNISYVWNYTVHYKIFILTGKSYHVYLNTYHDCHWSYFRKRPIINVCFKDDALEARRLNSR